MIRRSFLLFLGFAALAQASEFIDEDLLDAAAESQFNAIMQRNEAPSAPMAAYAPPRNVHVVQSNDAQITVDVDQYEHMRDALQGVREARQVPTPPRVVLGAARYDARAVEQGMALAIDVQLHATLQGDGEYKVVPLVGEDAVLVSASDRNGPVAITRDNGYHVWVTTDTGEVDLTLQLLVAADGPRGSLEYDFLVPMTPTTSFAFDYDDPSLQPRVTAAVRSVTEDHAEGARLMAELRPTARVRLVGFRAIDGPDRRAHLYSEALNLLSVDEHNAELFTVFRYNILYAGRRNFDIHLPDGFEVISAEGRGAFRYEVQRTDSGSQVLRGETAYPIRDDYEISLRLRRPLGDGPIRVSAPQTVGVEREYGWIGAEVTGRLLLEESERSGLTAVDVRQLPSEMVHSAVSPILRSYRYHDPDATLALNATALPERDVQSAAIDRVEATTVVSDAGTALTELRITLRNHLRHSLAMTLPPDARVRSAMLDGKPVKPSLAADGTLLLPLKRSGERAFTVQVVIEDDLGAFGWWGRLEPRLPALGLPVSSVEWSIHLPENRQYTGIYSDIDEQTQTRSGTWSSPAQGYRNQRWAPMDGEAVVQGAMPLSIELPTSGKKLHHVRYWYGANTPLSVQIGHLSKAALAPLGLGGVGLFTLAFGLAIRRRWRNWLPDWSTVTTMRQRYADTESIGVPVGLMPVRIAVLCVGMFVLLSSLFVFLVTL